MELYYSQSFCECISLDNSSNFHHPEPRRDPNEEDLKCTMIILCFSLGAWEHQCSRVCTMSIKLL
jgi:hypothetical protein